METRELDTIFTEYGTNTLPFLESPNLLIYMSAGGKVWIYLHTQPAFLYISIVHGFMIRSAIY